jgi:hypothetical protein
MLDLPWVVALSLVASLPRAKTPDRDQHFFAGLGLWSRQVGSTHRWEILGEAHALEVVPHTRLSWADHMDLVAC